MRESQSALPGSNGWFMRGRSCEAFASGSLTGEQERLDELTLATD